eukprot:352775-Chlamydomonas_euryale.AAC.11
MQCFMRQTAVGAWSLASCADGLTGSSCCGMVSRGITRELWLLRLLHARASGAGKLWRALGAGRLQRAGCSVC